MTKSQGGCLFLWGKVGGVESIIPQALTYVTDVCPLSIVPNCFAVNCFSIIGVLSTRVQFLRPQVRHLCLLATEDPLGPAPHLKPRVQWGIKTLKTN